MLVMSSFTIEADPSSRHGTNRVLYAPAYRYRTLRIYNCVLFGELINSALSEIIFFAAKVTERVRLNSLV